MGIVRFSFPTDLVKSLVTKGGIDGAVETGTFRADGTLALRQLVSRVWTVELSEKLYTRAVARYGDTPGITFLHGSSDKVLADLALVVEEPVIFWLDAHGGMVDMASEEIFNPGGDSSQCPLVAELETIHGFRSAATSCILIDDARGLLGPLPQHRPHDWPSLMQIIDLLRADCDRYITILDDVVIAVPVELREVVDHWWLEQTRSRDGRDGFEQNLWEAYNPSPAEALRRLVKSVTPMPLRRAYDRRR